MRLVRSRPAALIAAMLQSRRWSVLILACAGLASADAQSEPASPASPASPAVAAVNEDTYIAQGTLPQGVDGAGLQGQAYFFAIDKHEGAPGAIAPVVVGAEGLVIATDSHHVPGQVMVTEVLLQSPTLAPWWSVAWPDGKIVIGRPLKRPNAIRLHGVLISAEDGKPLAHVRIYGDSGGTVIGRSDAQGHFQCWVNKTSTQAHLLPFAPELVGHSRFVDATTYDDKDLTFTVEHGVRIRFRVVDTAGRPLSGVQVIWTGGASYQGLTDQSGEVVIGMVSRSAPHEPDVILSGYHLLKPIGEIIAAAYVDQPLVITLAEDPKPAPAPGPAPVPAPAPGH